MWPPYELEHAFQNGRLSRWEFFTRFSALGMVATSGLLSVMPAWPDTFKKGGGCVSVLPVARPAMP